MILRLCRFALAVAICASALPAQAQITLVDTAQQQGSNSPVTFTHGWTLTAGTVGVCWWSKNNYDGTDDCSDNNGADPWTENIDARLGTESGHVCQFSRVIDGTEASSFSWTIDDNGAWSITCTQYSNVDTVSGPWDVTPSTANCQHTSSGTTGTAPSITTGSANSLGIVMYACDGTPTYSGYSGGYVETVEENGGRGNAQADVVHASAGATGAVTVTLSSSNDTYGCHAALLAAAVASTEAFPLVDPDPILSLTNGGLAR